MNLSSFSYENPSELDRNIDVKSILKDRNLSYCFDRSENSFSSQHSFGYIDTFKNSSARNSGGLVIIPPRPERPAIVKYSTEQAYEGIVVEVNMHTASFTARLIDLTNNGPDEEGEFSFDELNGDDSLVIPGALFTWVIGMQRRGTRDQRVSEIRFRRIPPFSKQSIDRAEEEAKKLSQFFTMNYSADPLELHI